MDSKEPKVTPEGVQTLAEFVCALYKFYIDYNCAFLEINPFVLLRETNKIVVMDCAAKLDRYGLFERIE